MSQLAHHPAYLLIEDQLDALGQKYRLLRLLRGAMLFIACAVLSSLAASLTAHCTGPGAWAVLAFVLWIAWIIASLSVWLLRPLLLRPRPLEIARLVEARIPGLHNGLTNSILLTHADDLGANPWLAQILEEILHTSRSQSLDDAVKLSDLRALCLRLLAILAPVLLLALLWPTPFVHGWSQMFRPTVFVQQTGKMKIVDVQPRDVTLITGQPLEITVCATGPGAPESASAPPPDARIIFDTKLPAATVSPIQNPDQTLRYTYRVEHVDQPMKYRVEVGDAQTSQFTVTLVRQVKLQDLSLSITPPAYTRQASRSIHLKPEEIEKTPLTVLQGSRVELTATVDVPVNAAMLQIGESAPVPAKTLSDGRTFIGTLTVTDDAPVAVLLTDGAGQIIARLPEQALFLHCTKDAPPTIDMKWPTQDASVPPQQELKIQAVLKDDLGLSASRVLMASAADQPLVPAPAGDKTYSDRPIASELSFILPVAAELRKHGQSIWVQFEAVDNRELSSLLKDGGPQTYASPKFEIKFRDVQQIAKEDKEKTDKLRQRLMEMLKLQQNLHTQTIAYKPTDKAIMPKVNAGQTDLRRLMQQTATTFTFDENTKVVQKTLLMLAVNPAKEAIELSAAVQAEPVQKQQFTLASDLQSRQRRIISTLESLLALLNITPDPTTQPTTREGGDLANKKETFEKLNEALKEFMKEEQRILDQTAALAKKPVDNFTDADKKLLEDLALAQEKMEAFMQEKINDFSKNAEQDMSNAALLKEMMEVYSEVTMAKGALKEKATEIAVALEESGLELAKEISSNLEKWLSDKPDRQKWTMEDPVEKTDTPMAELPKELEDMVGELMEEQEDLFEEMEDTNANWTDSLDKGAGWDAADGPHRQHERQGRHRQSASQQQRDGRPRRRGPLGQEPGRVRRGNRHRQRRTQHPHAPRSHPPSPRARSRTRAKTPSAAPPAAARSPARAGAGLEGPRPSQDQAGDAASRPEAGRGPQQRRAPESPVPARPLRQLQAPGIHRPHAAHRIRHSFQSLPNRPAPPRCPARCHGHLQAPARRPRPRPARHHPPPPAPSSRRRSTTP